MKKIFYILAMALSLSFYTPMAQAAVNTSKKVTAKELAADRAERRLARLKRLEARRLRIQRRLARLRRRKLRRERLLLRRMRLMRERRLRLEHKK
jgi:hypothetical protein